MAQPKLDFFKKRGVAIAIEATEGTDAIPTVAANGVLLMNGSSGTEFDKIERPIDRPHFTGTPFVVGNKRAFIEGEFELYPPATPGGAATSDADCNVLLLPAGMTAVKDAVAKTTRYNPISANIPSATAYWWHVDTHKKVLGARNNITSLGITIGDRFKGQVRLQGAYDDVTQESLPSITLPSRVPAVARADNTETYITTLPAGAPLLVWAKSLSIEFGNQLATKEYTSLKTNGLSDRQPTWSLRIARTALADFNPWALRDAATPITGSLRLTESSNLYSEIGFRGQIDQINEVEIDGDYGWELTGPCVASDAGGDEFYIEFGDSTP